MKERSDYELLDAGDGRRLERFGDRLVDRPAPTAVGARRDPGAWVAADLSFDRESGWTGRPEALTPWMIRVDALLLELRPAPSGQVGFFPEHVSNLGWLTRHVAEREIDGIAVLNLFAHTGLATLALARAGARVAHVDASRPTVAWARRNAAASGLSGAPIRWLVEDAARFVGRELRRGRRYGGIVLDPPSWGHAVGGRTWRLDERLETLVEAVAALTDRRGFCLLTAHTSGLDPARLRRALAVSFDRAIGLVDQGPLRLDARSGAVLELGWYARVGPAPTRHGRP